MQRKNRQLIVYLSKSLKTEEKELQRVREQLTLRGFKVIEYKGGDYNPYLRASADFMLVVPHLQHQYEAVGKWKNPLGKGQYSEVKAACEENQPCFIYRGYQDGEILMAKCKEDVHAHYIYDRNDWKSKYGYVYSYVVGATPVPLYNFITGFLPHIGHVDERQRISEYPLTPKEAFINKDSEPRYYDLILLY